MTKERASENREEYDPGKHILGISAAALAVGSFFFFAFLLNAAGIRRNIELMKYGKFRDSALMVFKPVAEFCDRAGVTGFRKGVEVSVGRLLQNAEINR